MNYERPYSPVSHAPATAGTQLAPTRRYVRYAGTHCPHTYGVRVCSCAAIATEPCRPTACAGEHPNPSAYTTTAHYSLLTANSSYTFSAKGKDSETGLSYFGSRYYSSNLSIWLSVDPMSGKYPSLSPYVYCADNPVGLVDPNGDTVIVTGADADSYVQGLNTKNLTFSRDESGYVSYQGIAKTFLERRLVSAIKDPKIFVNICAENSTSIDNVGGATDDLQTAGGSFLGTVYEDGIVNTYQQVNPDILNKVTNDIGVATGMYERHELTESYAAGKISLRRKFSSPRAGLAGSVYPRAHNRASFAYNVELITTTIKVPVFKNNGLIDFFNTKSVTLSKYSIDDAD